MSTSPRTRTVVSCTLLVMALGVTVTACGSDGNPLAATPYDAADHVSFQGATTDATAEPAKAGKGTTESPGAQPAGQKQKPGEKAKPGEKPEPQLADPSKPLDVTAEGGSRITDVTAVDGAGRYLAGELSADGRRWHSTSPLAADARYTVRVSTENEDGKPGRRTHSFDTGKPRTQKRLDVIFGPDSGDYGVGQPVVAELSEPVADKAQRRIVERGLKVTAKPGVEGAWHWVNDQELHYRAKEFWPSNATINVRSNLNGIKINDRLWGGKADPLKLTTRDKLVAVADAGAHWMTVYRNDEEIMSMPVTTGKPGYETRNGVKVVLGQEYFVRMRGSSVGISASSSEGYNLPVYWATRVTWSGEYVHAAPWSISDHGVRNVSHGCVGMSTGNAAWFFENFGEGDVVEVVNSWGDSMEPFGNGFGDWNLDWKDWRTGSALLGGTPEGPKPEDALRLRPEQA
ncbi:Ig-like domain-containing protein [Streptomyces sp. NPDC004610]|uniref:L,D-transpeptidase n=1 Tax=unclassified Streptomyces TaxID=2593676 RepID=UPI0033B30BC6